MENLRFKTMLAAFILFAGIQHYASATIGQIKMTTNAPAGTELRIQAYPYDYEVKGADKSEYFGIYISKGEGSEIIVSAEALSQVEVYGCQLSNLDIVSGDDLFILRCYNNGISKLDLTGCKKLEVLDCHSNKITNLDLTQNPILEKINVSDNKLTSLDLGVKDAMTELDCSVNQQLKELDLSQCPSVNNLSFHNCSLTEIDLSNNKVLDWIYAYNNGIRGASMDKFISNLPVARATGLVYIVDTRAESENNECTMAQVSAFAEKGWATIDAQTSQFYPGCDYKSDVSDRQITLTTSRSAGETISLNIVTNADIEISGVQETAYSGKKTYTLTGSTVVISGDVTNFQCPGNDITSLSFSDPSLLTYLECQDNKITTLDLSGAEAMTQLHCQHNELTSLNLSGCTSLLRVNCYQNRIKGSAMADMMNSLCKSDNEPYLFVIDTEAPNGLEGNIATTDDVKIANEKGWKVYDYKNGYKYGMGIIYAGSEPTEPQLPAEYFTLTRSSKGHIMFTVLFADSNYAPVIEGGTISGWNGGTLTVNMTDETIKVYGDAVTINALYANIENIDITHLPNITELNIALNDIKNLNLTGNAKLKTLSCEGNLLEELDLSNCQQLGYVNCYGNQLKGTNMTAMIESLPIKTSESFGQLIVLDQTYQHEGNICLKSDVAKASDKYWATYELIDHKPMLYEGAEDTGIDEVINASTSINYDPDTQIVSVSEPATIEIYTVSGQIVAKTTNAKYISLATLNSGIYIIRSGGNVVKIVR